MALADTLARLIARQGPIRLSDYMAAASQRYYATRDPLGARGDFITAPEISQAFGEVLGLWVVDAWIKAGRPDPFRLVELGPGRGTMMGDLRRALRVAPDCAAAARLHLVETSPVLRARQAEVLPDAIHHPRLGAVPDGPMILIANEVLDCLPVRQLERTAQGWRERHVTLDSQGRFALCVPDTAPPQDWAVPPALRDAALGSVFEIAPAMTALAEEIALRLKDHGGAALLIDYGTRAPRLGASVQALRAHARADILDDPGGADITAHVDFAAVAAAAGRHVAVHGPVSQGLFLTRLGIDARAGVLARARPDRAESLAEGARRLTDPAAMGDLFQVLALTQGLSAAPEGFAATPPGAGEGET